MGDFPALQGSRQESSLLVTVTASGSANAKGSWTELIATTGFQATGIAVFGRWSTVAGGILDIGIGAAGSEQVLVPNLRFNAKMDSTSTAGHTPAGMSPVFPISVPAGSRISARLQSAAASATQSVRVVLLGGGFLPGEPQGKVTDYGVGGVGASFGTQITPSATANTYGSWVQLSSGISAPINALVIALGDQNSTGPGDGNWLIDVGVGAASSEVAVLSGLPFSWWLGATGSPCGIGPQMLGPFPVSIPSGARLSARTQSTRTSPSLAPDVVVYGIT